MAEKEEEKGFVIKDKRRFSSDEEAGEEARAESQAAGKEDEGARGPGETGPGEASGEAEQERGPFPEVSMATFIFSLSSSALVHLGEIPEPETNQTRLDLAIAKQIIDTLGMLQEKTMGNLDQDEDRLMRSVLYDLRMRYVQKMSGK
ncbi:MAG: DUF1844 domain-containing protein [Syntrophobacteraceae bacterium]